MFLDYVIARKKTVSNYKKYQLYICIIIMAKDIELLQEDFYLGEHGSTFAKQAAVECGLQAV